MTVWPKIASELTWEAQNIQNFLGEHAPDPLLSCIEFPILELIGSCYHADTPAHFTISFCCIDYFCSKHMFLPSMSTFIDVQIVYTQGSQVDQL